MSLEALAWALNDAPGLPPHAFGVLMGLANHADKLGRAAYPSQTTLAHYARKSTRQVRRDLDDLAAAGLIRRGDDRHVAHIPGDERPIVWDLAMERTRDDPDAKPKRTGRTRPVARVRPDVDDRPDADVRSPETASEGTAGQEDLDRTPTSGRTPTSARTSTAEGPDVHVLLTVLEPTTEEVLRTSSSARKRASPTKRGTRIPDDFTVTPEMVAWCRSKCPGVDGRRETEKFVNYWTAKTGSGATKLDWAATWRNWMLNAAERSGPRAVPADRRATTDLRLDQADAALIEFRRITGRAIA